MTAKPTVTELGIDLAVQVWQRSGRGPGAIEVAFARTPASPPVASSRTPASPPVASSRTPASPPVASSPAPSSLAPAEWVLMRVAGDPEQRVLVFDRHEWECFLDGARNGEFDDAASSGALSI